MRALTCGIAKSILAATILIASIPCVSQTAAKSSGHTITIFMVNGKTGKPVRHKSVLAKFPGNPHRTIVRVDDRGFGRLEIPSGTIAFSLSAPRAGKKHRPAYTACGPFNDLIPVKGVLAHGYVPLDACSPTLQLKASPGVLLYFMQPLPWYPPSRE